MKRKLVELDVRPDLAEGREPFGRIMHAIQSLKPGQDLRLIAPFEPQPLYGVLVQHGYKHKAQLRTDGAWEIIFSQETGLAT